MAEHKMPEPVAWVAADTLNSPHPTCISSLAYMSQLDLERGREYVPLYSEATVRALLAEVDALRKDAERYRWLRERIAGKEHVDEDFANNPGYSDGEVLAKEVDAAIDAAIAADDAQPQGEEVGRG